MPRKGSLPTCVDCRWWVQDGTTTVPTSNTVAMPWGACHRYPPTIIPVDDGEQLDNDHPNTLADDWCGEFSP